MQITKQRFFKSKNEIKQEENIKDDGLFVSDSDEEEDLEPKSGKDSDYQPDSSSQQLDPTRIDLSKNQQYQKFAAEIKDTVGEVSPIILTYLFDKYQFRPNLVKAAINELFTNPPDIELIKQGKIPVENESSTRQKKSAPLKSTQNRQKRCINEIDPDIELEKFAKKANLIAEQVRIEEEAQSWSRFVGSLDLQAWATRPTVKPLAYRSELFIKRLIPRNASMKNTAIIRIVHQDREIGRMPEDITRILAPLIDLDICSFKAMVLEDTKTRLSTGDSFFIQIEIYLKSTGFIKNLGDVVEEENIKLNKKKGKSNFNFSSESDGEAVLRLRQFAIQNLFDKLRIKPLKINDDDEEEDDDEKILPEIEKDTETPLVSNEINLDQLRQFYQANNENKLFDSLPETTEPPEENFNLKLREYQKHGLSWMLAREKEFEILDILAGEKVTTQARANIEDNGSMNPLWRKYKWPTPDNDNKYFYANLYNGELSLEKPIIKSTLKGGILADEMGLGKTISTLSLIASVPYDNNPPPKILKQLPYAYRTTLIVVPMSLLSQWKEEFERSNNNSQHYCRLYYGDDQELDLTPSLCNNNNNKIPIIVLTTYGTILNEFTRISKNRRNGELPRIGLYSVKFFRIILDEGHNIRNRSTKTAKSIYELQSSCKWILTGTPIVNRLDDLYSLTKFLELDPWNNFSYWKTFITLPFENKKISQTLDVIKSILEPIFLRRTKNQKMKNGKPLVELPAKEVIIEDVKFNEQESKLYQWFQKRAYDSFKENMKSGQILKKYTQILTLILRLRQVCCHVDLIGGSHEMDDDVIDQEEDEETKKFLKDLKTEHTNKSDQNGKFSNDTEVKKVMFTLYDKILNENECSICTTTAIPFNELVVTQCGHTFCLTCILEHLDFQNDSNKPKSCPNCRELISRYKLFKLRNQTILSNEIKFHTGIEPQKKEYKFQLYLYDPNKSSSKIQALTKHLKTLKQQSPNSKCIIFSQFSSYLDLIEIELKLMDEFIIYKFDGRLNMNDRSKLLNNFNAPISNGKIVILLLSLKAGGVGLNLTTASRAFMMDPWWSPSIEDQAIDRIHRIGQNETVKVVRFIMENSIETKMLKIQERKKQIGEVVGVEEEERRRRRIEEIQILFEE
ncbi:unnamed protein product [Candida verbasci]|uniref:DNA repair protein RAD5 n=1 Tax=Candida verbasci TaxID=1227364 RepID=A0A9W4TUE6_9ASCO|nr:unnamed protein product [Candida verbasci]